MSTKFEVDGNTAVLVHEVKRSPPKLEDVSYDKAVWEIDHYVQNSWESAMKGDGGPIVVPIYQLKIWFRRKIATKTVIPPIAPVNVQVKKGRKPRKQEHALKSAFIFPDAQIGFRRTDAGLEPFHDREAIGCAFELVRDIQPDRIVVLGDLLDCTDWSDKFVRSPDESNLTQESLKEAAYVLGKLRALAPLAKIDYLLGNHEERVTRLVKAQLPAAFGLKPVDCELPALSMATLLGLDKLDIESHEDYPNDKVWLNQNICCIHGNVVKPHSGQTASALLQHSNHSVIFGHVHRSEQATEARHHHDGVRFYTAYSPGCVCRIDGAVPGAKREQNWSQGCGLVYYEEGNSPFTIRHIPIFNGRAVWQGRYVSGSF